MASKTVEKIWIDTETTGLEDDDVILELGLILTDKWGNEIADASWLVGENDPRYFEAINRGMKHEIVGSMHEQSGLWKDWEQGDYESPKKVAYEAINFLQEWGVKAGSLPMSGRSVHFDRRKLSFEMPLLEAFFHYRNYDISTLYQTAQDHNPNIAAHARLMGNQVLEQHRVMHDLRSTIAEYQVYLTELIFVEGEE